VFVENVKTDNGTHDMLFVTSIEGDIFYFYLITNNFFLK